MSRWERIKSSVHYLLNRMVWLLVVGLCANTIFVLLFMVVEHRSFVDSMWWGWVTGFTVGYGDIFPVTILGRVIAVLAMATNLVLLLCFGGQITAMVIIAKDLYSDIEQGLSKHRDDMNERIGRAKLESNYRLERALGCLPNNLPEIPEYETDEEVMARLADASKASKVRLTEVANHTFE